MNEKDFLGDSRLGPICIPKNNSLDFIGRLATYFGTGLGEHPSMHNYDFYYGIINSNRVCEKHSDNNENDGQDEPFLSLCVHWVMKDVIEENENFFKGGSLFIHSTHDGRAFLAGINREIEKGFLMYAQFTNILPFIKYIEHKAKLHNSTWCRMNTGLVLPKKVANPDYSQLPFEGEPSEGMGKGSWWCVEHENILDKTSKTDFERFAEGENIIRKELYKCNEHSGDRSVIQFFQKGREEPIGEASLQGTYYWDCFEIKKEWVSITDIVSATESVFLLDSCDEAKEKFKIKLSAGEKLNLEWLGLTSRVTSYKLYNEPSSAYSRIDVIFYSSNGKELNYYNPYDLCACNNLDPKLGIPSRLISLDNCLELYAEKNCKGWIRTIPAGLNTIHSENLMVNGKISYPQTKSFRKCAILPNCYQLDVGVYSVILKNKGVKNWNIPFKEYPIIPTQTIVNEEADGQKTYDLERDLSGFKSVVKIQLPKGKSLGMTQSDDEFGPKLEMEDENGADIPYLPWKTLDSRFRGAYDDYFHYYQKDTEQHESEREYFPWDNEYILEKARKYPLTLKGNVKATVYEYINVAKDFEFSYDVVLKIHGWVANGESMSEEMLKEKVESDLGYKEKEKCGGDNEKFCHWGKWVKVRLGISLKLTMTLVNHRKKDKNVCVKDEEKCTEWDKCKCYFGGGDWSVPGTYWW